MAVSHDYWLRTPDPDPSEAQAEQVTAKLHAWLSDAGRVANALDDLGGTSDHTAAGCTCFSEALASFVLADDRVFERVARRYRDDLVAQLGAQMRPDAENEVLLEQAEADEARSESVDFARRAWA